MNETIVRAAIAVVVVFAGVIFGERLCRPGKKPDRDDSAGSGE